MKAGFQKYQNIFCTDEIGNIYLHMSGNAEFEWKGLSQRVQFEFKIVFEFDMKGVEIEPRLHVQQGGATQIHPPLLEFKNDFQFEREGSARRAAIEFNQPKSSRVSAVSRI